MTYGPCNLHSTGKDPPHTPSPGLLKRDCVAQRHIEFSGTLVLYGGFVFTSEHVCGSGRSGSKWS